MAERSLKDLFHRVIKVLPDSQELIVLHPEMSVSDAFDLMGENNINQVPIVAGHEVLGVFSYRSFATGIKNLPKNENNPLGLPVEEFIEDLRFARITDELNELIDEFNLKDAVLVGNEEKLQGIITTIDTLRYFYKVANPYVLLREIELAVRELIRASLVEENAVRDCIEKSLKRHYEDSGREPPASLEELTFHDYVMLLRFKGTWGYFQPTFGANSNLVYSKLAPLPELRNVVFHFKREVTVGEYELLRDVRDWLLKRIRKFEAS